MKALYYRADIKYRIRKKMKFIKCLNEKKMRNKNSKWWYIKFIFEFENNEFESITRFKAETKEEAIRKLKDSSSRSLDTSLVDILDISDSRSKLKS